MKKTVKLGAMVGVAAGIMIASKMDRKTRKKIKKIEKRMKNTVEDLYFSINGHVI